MNSQTASCINSQTSSCKLLSRQRYLCIRARNSTNISNVFSYAHASFLLLFPTCALIRIVSSVRLWSHGNRRCRVKHVSPQLSSAGRLRSGADALKVSKHLIQLEIFFRSRGDRARRSTPRLAPIGMLLATAFSCLRYHIVQKMAVLEPHSPHTPLGRTGVPTRGFQVCT
uniref:Uncharacterized protein n=1 Tax=Ixodes ricinus TaxID=34613 RepID=A0A0K8R941_IXORI